MAIGVMPGRVTDTTVYANMGTGIRVLIDGSANLSSVTSVNNQGCGLEFVHEWGSGSTIENSIFAFNQDAGLTVDPSEVSIACTDVFANTGGDWDAIPGYLGIDGNFSADPLFCDPASDDYHLQNISPCALGRHPDGADCGLIGALGIGCYIAPEITTVEDIPADQGLQVRLTWTASSSDDPGADPSVASYAIYRRIDEDERRVATDDPTGRRLEGWDYITSVPVRGDAVYHHVTPTLCDSTATGVCWSTFFVSAVTDDPYVFYDSLPDSGYSIDNIVPSAPSEFTVNYGEQNGLSWDASNAPDLAWYNIHREATADFDPGPDNLVHQTSSLVWNDADGSWHAYYRLVAVDDAGNESDPVAPNQMTSTGDVVPTRTELVGNYPNPFNPSTTIAYNLARRTRVSVRIYDLRGLLVAEFVTGEDQGPGSYELVWTGRDDKGQTVASGAYICRLETAKHVETKRMVLVK